MKVHFPHHTRRGITFVEMLCGVAVVLLAMLVVLPSLSRSNHHGSSYSRTHCINNLKQIGLAFRIYANESGDQYPMQVPDTLGGAKDSAERGDLFRVFLVLSNELSVPKTLVCRADARIAAPDWGALSNTNISYFIGLDATPRKPHMVLAGDRNLARDGVLLSGIVSLSTNSPLTWVGGFHEKSGNMVLADGSVQQFTRGLLWQQLAHSGDTTNRVLFPQ